MSGNPLQMLERVSLCEESCLIFRLKTYVRYWVENSDSQKSKERIKVLFAYFLPKGALKP